MGLAATGLGCGGANPFLLIPTLFSGGQAKTPAEFPLTVPAKKSEAKVVVLVSAKMGLSPDLAGVDRMLNAELVRILDAHIKENEQKVQVLKTQVLDNYKSENPNWRTASPQEIGKEFMADYVIDVEVRQMDLYKPGSRGQWLQGRAAVTVSAYDLSKQVRDAKYVQDFSIDYPRDHEIENDSPAVLSDFRMKFIRRIASDIAMKFTDTTQKVHDMN
jgi:hypothetical protein